MSDTPETDAAWDKYISPHTYSAGDLRILAERLERERDEAREQNAKLLSIAERAIDDLRWFYESKADGIILELDQLKEGAK